jgi:two-component system phosphate regulon response regulator PhoB
MLTNVLIVEDEPAIAESIRADLELAGIYAIIASTADTARRLISTMLPDLILLKWILRGESATTFAKDLQVDMQTRRIPLILLGPSPDERLRIDEMIRSADGCVEQPFQQDEIVARIRAVLRTRRFPRLADKTVTVGSLSVDPVKKKVFLHRDGRQIELRVGRTERRLLYLFISNPDRLYSRAQLVQQLWGDREAFNERLVDSYVKRLRASLRSAQCDHIVESIRGMGYKFARDGTSNG